MDCHALIFQLLGQWGRGTVVAGHGVAIVVVITGEGAHADAANA